jgi:uncharacterized protein
LCSKSLAAPLVALAAAALLFAGAPARAQRELPTDRLLKSLTSSGHVNDFAGILQPAQREALEARCLALKEKTGAELAVVTLKSLEGGQIDDFAVKLFERWQIGQKGKDNGVLLLVAIDDRKARIETGYGLEPILPDALAGRILTEQLTPAFREQRYYDGLLAAANRIIELVERNEPAAKQPVGGIDVGISPMMLILTVLIAISAFAAGAALRAGGGCSQAAMFAAFLIFGGCLLAFPWAPAFHVPLAIILAWLGWLSGENRNRGRRRSRGRGPSPVDVWGSGWSGGGFSGGGFSGGGFSGGGGWGGFSGGRSGGGGASVGW